MNLAIELCISSSWTPKKSYQFALCLLRLFVQKNLELEMDGDQKEEAHAAMEDVNCGVPQGGPQKNGFLSWKQGVVMPLWVEFGAHPDEQVAYCGVSI